MTQNLQDPIRNAFLVDLSSFQIRNKGELKEIVIILVTYTTT